MTTANSIQLDHPGDFMAVAERKILLIEDDPDIAALVDLHLRDEQFEIDVEANGSRGLELFSSKPFDLVILDVMLPGLGGFEICKRIRRAGNQVPILMLTSKSEEFDKVLGLELGADDYLTKPFGIRELVARVKALLRRAGTEAPTNKPSRRLEFANLSIDTEKRRVTLDGNIIELTNKEFELLVLFATSPGRAFSRTELLREVWGYQYSGYSHTVNSHINRLRGKIETDPANPVFIQTVWGVGYRFNESE